MGTAENGRFTGNYIFYVKLRCKVFHPETDTPIECKVIKVNKMGAYAVFDEAMRVLLPRDLHIGNVEFDGLSPDDTITLQILRSRFQTNDPFISAVGMFISRSKKGKAPVAEKAKVPEPEAGEEQQGEIFEPVVEVKPAAAPKAKAPRGKVAKVAVAAPVAEAEPAPVVEAAAAVPVTPAAVVEKPKRGRKRLVVSDEAPVAEAPVAAAPQPVAAAPPAPATRRRAAAPVAAPVAVAAPAPATRRRAAAV
jgi:hypothetical protein